MTALADLVVCVACRSTVDRRDAAPVLGYPPRRPHESARPFVCLSHLEDPR